MRLNEKHFLNYYNHIEPEPQVKIKLCDSEDQDFHQGGLKLRGVQTLEGVHSGDEKDNETTLPENNNTLPIDVPTTDELSIEETPKPSRSGRKTKHQACTLCGRSGRLGQHFVDTPRTSLSHKLN